MDSRENTLDNQHTYEQGGVKGKRTVKALAKGLAMQSATMKENFNIVNHTTNNFIYLPKKNGEAAAKSSAQILGI